MKICVFLLAELESYDAGRNSKLTCHSLKSCGSVVSVDSLFIVCSPICLKSSVQPAHFLLEQKLEIVIFYRASQKKLSFTGLSICRICRLHFPLAKVPPSLKIVFWLFLTKIKHPQVIFRGKFGPTASNFG